MNYYIYRMPIHYNTHLHAKCSEKFKIDSCITAVTTSVTDVMANIRQKNVLKQLMTIRIGSEKKGYFMNEFCRPIRRQYNVFWLLGLVTRHFLCNASIHSQKYPMA